MKLSDYPHLVEMKKKIESIQFGTVEYWRERCKMLEKNFDPTYGDFERANCREFYMILVKKEK